MPHLHAHQPKGKMNTITITKEHPDFCRVGSHICRTFALGRRCDRSLSVAAEALAAIPGIDVDASLEQLRTIGQCDCELVWRRYGPDFTHDNWFARHIPGETAEQRFERECAELDEMEEFYAATLLQPPRAQGADERAEAMRRFLE